MLNPSYSELMDQLNNDIDLDNKITSRYTIVIAAAKRARQIIDGAPCCKEGVKTDKAVSIAVNEMYKGMIKLLPDGLPQDNDTTGTQDEVINDDYFSDFGTLDDGFDDFDTEDIEEEAITDIDDDEDDFM